MKINLLLSPNNVDDLYFNGKTTVVIDVLRATSVILKALNSGAREVIPVGSIDFAMKISVHAHGGHTLLCGERNTKIIEGFDLGNSPLEYSRKMVQGRGIILTTTNGTQALGMTKGAVKVLVSAFINLSATVEYLAKTDHPVHLLCSGTNGEFSMDDFLCAGGVISKLGNKTSIITDDLGNLARQSWESQTGPIIDTLSSCKHANILREHGFLPDLEFCLQPDTQPLLAEMITSTYNSPLRRTGMIYPVS